MPTETTSPRPLEAEEIKTGICQIIADAVYEKLSSTVNLYGRAYPKFKGTITIALQLDNFGDVTIDNHTVRIEGGEGEITEGSIPLDADITIGEMPPNQFRQETNQPVIKKIEQPDGSKVEQKVRYKPRPKAAKK